MVNYVIKRNVLECFHNLILFRLGHEKIAELLIKSRANINSADQFGDTILIYAINKGIAKTGSNKMNYSK